MRAVHQVPNAVLRIERADRRDVRRGTRARLAVPCREPHVVARDGLRQAPARSVRQDLLLTLAAARCCLIPAPAAVRATTAPTLALALALSVTLALAFALEIALPIMGSTAIVTVINVVVAVRCWVVRVGPGRMPHRRTRERRGGAPQRALATRAQMVCFFELRAIVLRVGRPVVVVVVVVSHPFCLRWRRKQEKRHSDRECVVSAEVRSSSMRAGSAMMQFRRHERPSVTSAVTQTAHLSIGDDAATGHSLV